MASTTTVSWRTCTVLFISLFSSFYAQSDLTVVNSTTFVVVGPDENTTVLYAKVDTPVKRCLFKGPNYEEFIIDKEIHSPDIEVVANLTDGWCAAKFLYMSYYFNGNWTIEIIPESPDYAMANANMTLLIAHVPIIMLLTPEEIVVNNSQYVEIQCVAWYSRPAANLNWTLDDEPLQGIFTQSYSNSSNEFEYSTYQSYIGKFGPEQHGKTFRCNGSINGFPDTYTQSSITVHFPPQNMTPNDQPQEFGPFPLGQKANFTALIFANPEPDVIWDLPSGEGQLLAGNTTSDGRVTSNRLEPVPDKPGFYGAELIVWNLQESDCGVTFYLNATNDYGYYAYPIVIIGEGGTTTTDQPETTTGHHEHIVIDIDIEEKIHIDEWREFND